MSTKVLTSAFLVVTLMGLVGCGGSSGLNPNAPSQLLESADSLLSSAGGSSGGALPQIVLNVEEKEDRASENDPNCDVNARPWDGTELMASTHADYPARVFECRITSNNGSPESLRGSFSLLRGVLCSFESALGAIDYTEEGNNLIDPEEGLNMTLPDRCWDGGAPDGMESIQLTSAVATLLDPQEAGFQYRIQLTALMDEEEEMNFRLEYFVDGDRFGFKTGEQAENGRGQTTLVSVDLAEGIIAVNSIDDRGGAGGADSSFRRLVAFRVEGELTRATLQFTSITEREGIVMENSGGGVMNPADDDIPFSAVTMTGSAAAGYLYGHQSFDGADVTDVDHHDVCSVEGGCDGLNVIEFEDGAYFQAPGAETNKWSTLHTSAMPVCTNEPISKTDGIPSMGPLGICAD